LPVCQHHKIEQKQKQNKTWDTDKVKKHENRRKKRSLKNKKNSTRGPKEMKIHDCPKKKYDIGQHKK
jgi:hypothetical protein